MGSTWTQQVKLTANDGNLLDHLARSVSISGDYAIVGANKKLMENDNQGAAYIFHRSGSAWTQQAKLLADNGATGGFFGNSVSISGDYAIVGTGEDLKEWTDQGSAYIFYYSGGSWVQQAKLTANDEEYGDEFGNSVSISGDYAIVGNHLDDIGEDEDQGSVYIFHRIGSTWTQQVKLTANDGNLLDHFGSSVSISGDYVIVGLIKN